MMTSDSAPELKICLRDQIESQQRARRNGDEPHQEQADVAQAAERADQTSAQLADHADCR